MAAVGPDSLAAATAMPSMSAFLRAGSLLTHPKHIGSAVGPYGSEDISRGQSSLRRDWAVCGDVLSFLYTTGRHATRLPALHGEMNEIVATPP